MCLFSFISRVKKKMLGEDLTVNKRLSIPTQALKLLSEGKSLIEVTITLDRPISETRGYHSDFLRLKNMDCLLSLIESHIDILPTVSKLIKHIIQNPFTKNDLIIALELVYDINRLRSVKKTLEEKIEILNEAKNHLLNSKRRMNQY